MSKELEALTKIELLLENLSEEEIIRILKWITDKYLQGPNTGKSQATSNALFITNTTSNFEQITAQSTPAITEKFPTLANLLSVSHHKTEADRLLLAAYWYTNGSTDTPFHSNNLTSELRNTGYHIKKVSNPIDSLKNRKPQYIIQTGKNSKTKGKNGRITYKITAAGIKYAKGLIDHDITDN